MIHCWNHTWAKKYPCRITHECSAFVSFTALIRLGPNESTKHGVVFVFLLQHVHPRGLLSAGWRCISSGTFSWLCVATYMYVTRTNSVQVLMLGGGGGSTQSNSNQFLLNSVFPQTTGWILGATKIANCVYWMKLTGSRWQVGCCVCAGLSVRQQKLLQISDQRRTQQLFVLVWFSRCLVLFSATQDEQKTLKIARRCWKDNLDKVLEILERLGDARLTKLTATEHNFFTLQNRQRQLWFSFIDSASEVTYNSFWYASIWILRSSSFLCLYSLFFIFL